MKEFQEGKAIFKANLSGKDKGPGKAKGVFYNPAMKLSRDLHVAFAQQFDFHGVMLDGLAASGVRGIRLSLETGINVEFCDNSRLAVDTIINNLKMNGMNGKVHHRNVEELLEEEKYDWIDIDPFGTPAPYLNAALKGVKENGIIGIAATDTAVLCGAKPSVCKERYGAVSMKKVAAKEVGVRILLAKICNLASKIERGIEPILCYSEGHHLRVFIKIIKTKKEKLGWLTNDMRVMKDEEKESAGPLWTGRIIDSNMVPTSEKRILKRMLETLREEADGPPGLHDINNIAKVAEIGQTPRRTKIVECIRRLGFFASSSVFSPLGVKTDATEDARIQAVKLAQSL